MKKFFEKYDLIKVAGILVLISVVLTWLIPYGYFSGSEMVVEDITRVGLTNFYQYGLLGMYYFTVLVTFLFVLGGFYQLLSKQPGYQKLIKNISGKLKGREVPFVLIVSLIFAILSSLINEYFPLLALIPFIIAILNKMKVDKITSFVATFGGLLVGTIGSTYSEKVAGYLLSTFNVEIGDVLTTQTIIFVIAYILLGIFTVIRMKKLKGDKKFEEYDKFEIETTETSKKETKTWPYVVGLILFVITIVLAYLPWSSWEITFFADATTWVNELAIADQPIISYIFGEFTEFGAWDIFTVQFVMLFATMLIHWFSKTKLDDVFESYGEGFKKMGPVIVVMLVVYFILELAVMYPVVPIIVDWIASLTEGFSAILSFIAAAITSVFSVEMQYAMSLAGSYFAATYTEVQSVLVIIFQTAFGLVSFFVPSSAILMIGLSYLNIPYKDWMKFIWKFLLAMLVVIIVIILIIA